MKGCLLQSRSQHLERQRESPDNPDVVADDQAGARPDLSFVFPAFDEEENLDPLLESARKIGEQLGLNFEIVVVDDGSRDKGPEVLAAWARRDPRIRMARHPRNTGYGAALRTGLELARGKLIFFSDADLQFDLSELKYLLQHTSSFDIVAGYRNPRRDPWPRIPIAKAWALLVRFLFGLRTRDIDCAFKVIRRKVIEEIPLASVGAFINTELLVRAKAAGFKIYQVPVSHRRRQKGRQTGAHPRVILSAIRELTGLYRELKQTDIATRHPDEFRREHGGPRGRAH